MIKMNDRCVHTKLPNNNHLNNRMLVHKDQHVEPRHEQMIGDVGRWVVNEYKQVHVQYHEPKKTYVQ